MMVTVELPLEVIVRVDRLRRNPAIIATRNELICFLVETALDELAASADLIRSSQKKEVWSQ